ncbi:MAG: glycosyltransferase family 9 protein [Candidatus Omnitrophica bacterium]|nr:glycosyltransferase family 9 protein [Candidatus Omnitrophota bacterium]
MKPLRRVLVVQPYGIGDLLFVTPVLRALRLCPSVEKVDLLLGSRTDVVVSQNPHVDEIFSVDKDLFHRQGKMQTFRDVLALGKKLRANHYDLLLDYSLRGEYAFFGQFSLGIPKRVGFNYKRRGFFQTQRLSIPKGFSGRHVADYFCDLAELAGIPVEDRFLEFYPDRKNIKHIQIPFEKYMVMSPGGGESWGKDAHFKRWPPRFFAELGNGLIAKNFAQGIVLLGSPSEKELSQELRRNLHVPCLDLTGEISLSDGAALIERAELFAGNDGGLMHLAHALQTPLIAFYGPVDPAVYGPYPASEKALVIVKENLDCRPCYQKFRYNSACVGRECLQDLTPAEVFQFLERKHFIEQILYPAADIKGGSLRTL